jgi:hypothetical protein
MEERLNAGEVVGGSIMIVVAICFSTFRPAIDALCRQLPCTISSALVLWHPRHRIELVSLTYISTLTRRVSLIYSTSSLLNRVTLTTKD